MSVRDDTIQPGKHTHAQRYRVLPDLCMLLLELKCVREHKLYIVRKVYRLRIFLPLELFLNSNRSVSKAQEHVSQIHARRYSPNIEVS